MPNSWITFSNFRGLAELRVLYPLLLPRSLSRPRRAPNGPCRVESGLNTRFVPGLAAGLRVALLFRDKCIRIAQSRFAERATIGPSSLGRAVASNQWGVRKPVYSHSTRDGVAQFSKEM